VTDDEFEQRLANPLPPGHPDYDAFYDASDADLAEIVSEALGNAEETPDARP
jgi:hypothetical protein